MHTSEKLKGSVGFLSAREDVNSEDEEGFACLASSLEGWRFLGRSRDCDQMLEVCWTPPISSLVLQPTLVSGACNFSAATVAITIITW